MADSEEKSENSVKTPEEADRMSRERLSERARRPEKIPSIKDMIKSTFSIHEDEADPEEVRNRILSGGRVTGMNASMLMLAIIIASVGLNTNSTAVIIGAMLISPLMGSILGIAYGTVLGDHAIIRRYIIGTIVQVVIAIGTSTIYFALSPVKTATPELLARTQPTFFDVIIATAGGLAGIIANTRKEKSVTVIPGVAIATAIMPPLCTCGYSIANRNSHMFFGAFYLFIINAYFIFSSSELILAAMRFPKECRLCGRKKRAFFLRKARNIILIVSPCVLFALGITFNK